MKAALDPNLKPGASPRLGRNPKLIMESDSDWGCDVQEPPPFVDFNEESPRFGQSQEGSKSPV